MDPCKGRAEVAAYADCPENRMMAVSDLTRLMWLMLLVVNVSDGGKE